jgi:hypothetical protein
LEPAAGTDARLANRDAIKRFDGMQAKAGETRQSSFRTSGSEHA